ncbi:hypothetical protein K1719_034684 [Acacia pycnantha]|nr:hypothetical protein K1719_034684 [Acacia pycnantha]
MSWGEIERKARKDDKAFKSLKRSYGSVPYKMIGNRIIENKVEEEFEILFIIYALGTLLCPTASIKISDALLKVIVATKEDFREYDWCTFVLNELCNSIGEYKKKVGKGKGTVTGNTIYIGGCMYFFMIYCLQNFPLDPLQAPTVEDAIHFWDDTKIKRRVKIERESKKGLLLPYGDEVGQSSTELHPETALTHSEIKRTYDRIMSRVFEELLSLQASLFKGAESDEGDVNDEVQSEDEEPCSQNEEDGGDIQKEDEDEDEGSKATGEDEGSKNEDHTSQQGEQSEHNNDSTEDELNVGEEFKNLRKSTRIKRPAIGSPWVVITVGMYDYFLNRGDLQCLRPKQWISDRFMSMVAKTLVGDELKKSGHVRRHIFSSELMQKMANNPHKWSLEAHEKELLPEHIGYNIGDCDFIVGPTLHLSHWFCYIFEIKTMCFYAIDSYVDNLTYLKIQNEEEEAMKGSKQLNKPKRLTKSHQEMFKAKDWLASRCRDCFHKILRRVKPELFAKGRQIPDQVNWAKVHLQNDTHSCGIHVLSWLHGWNGSPQDKEGCKV